MKPEPLLTANGQELRQRVNSSAQHLSIPDDPTTPDMPTAPTNTGPLQMSAAKGWQNGPPQPTLRRSGNHCKVSLAFLTMEHLRQDVLHKGAECSEQEKQKLKELELMSACCLGKDPFELPNVQNVQARQRQIVGVYSALMHLGAIAPGFVRWLQFIIVIFRVGFNVFWVMYNYLSQLELRNAKRYRRPTKVLIVFEMSVVFAMVTFLVWLSLKLVVRCCSHKRQSVRSGRDLAAVKLLLLIHRFLVRIGLFSALWQLRSSLNPWLLYRYYVQLWHGARGASSYTLRSLLGHMGEDVPILATVLNALRALVLSEGPVDMDSNMSGGKAVATTSSPNGDAPGLRKVVRNITLLPRLADTEPPTSPSIPNYRNPYVWLHRGLALILTPMVIGLTIMALLVLPFALLLFLAYPIWSLIAFFLKIQQMGFIWDTSISRWQRANYVRFAALLNNLAVLDQSYKAESHGKLCFLFFGSDGQNTPEESQALHCFYELVLMEAWQQQGMLKALVIFNSLSPADINAAFIRDWETKEIRKSLMGHETGGEQLPDEEEAEQLPRSRTWTSAWNAQLWRTGRLSPAAKALAAQLPMEPNGQLSKASPAAKAFSAQLPVEPSGEMSTANQMGMRAVSLPSPMSPALTENGHHDQPENSGASLSGFPTTPDPSDRSRPHSEPGPGSQLSPLSLPALAPSYAEAGFSQAGQLSASTAHGMHGLSPSVASPSAGIDETVEHPQHKPGGLLRSHTLTFTSPDSEESGSQLLPPFALTDGILGNTPPSPTPAALPHGNLGTSQRLQPLPSVPPTNPAGTVLMQQQGPAASPTQVSVMQQQAPALHSGESGTMQQQGAAAGVDTMQQQAPASNSAEASTMQQQGQIAQRSGTGATQQQQAWAADSLGMMQQSKSGTQTSPEDLPPYILMRRATGDEDGGSQANQR